MSESSSSGLKYADIFDKLADKLTDETWKKPPTVPSTVFHYTNADGLYGILTSKQVWATDYRFLNDMLEGEIGLSRAKEVIRNAYFQVEDGPKRRLYREVLDVLRVERSETNFVFSLSSRRDDLGQWRAYADDGAGFTVGFDTKRILEVANKPGTAFGFGKVSYSSSEFDRKVRGALRRFEVAIEKEKLSGSALTELTEEAALYLDVVIGTFSVGYKHSSFRSEFEWRVNTFIDQGDPDNEVLVRSNGRRLVPYVPLRLCRADEDCLPITHVGIGPGFRDSGIRYAVEKLCRQTGVAAKIYNADTPFRRI